MSVVFRDPSLSAFVPYGIEKIKKYDFIPYVRPSRIGKIKRYRLNDYSKSILILFSENFGYKPNILQLKYLSEKTGETEIFINRWFRNKRHRNKTD
jgi:hypothetical protein